MTVTYWTGFNKRKNSTKTPSTGTDVSVALKDDTSILNPAIDSATIPQNANYMYISDFGRYYYVRNATKVGAGRTLFELEVDPMSTYKSSIGASSALIEYAGDSTNIHLTDPRNKPQQVYWEKTSKLLDLSANQFTTGGTFIVGVTGGPGGVTYYVMDATKLQSFYSELFDPSFISQITTQFYNAKDCVVSCRWIPYTPAVGLAVPVNIGGLTMSVSAPTVAVRIKTISDASYNIGFPSDDLGYGTNYLDLEPFTTGTIYLPFVGIVPMDLGVVSQGKQVRIECYVDNYTSEILYKLSNASGDYINTYQGNCGVNIPIVSQTYNAAGAAGGVLSALGGVVSGVAGAAIAGPAAGLAAGIGAGVLGASSLAQSMSIHTQMNGSISSALGAQIGLAAYATVITRQPTVQNLTDYATTCGMPFFQVDTISNHTGYVQCYNASIGITGTPQEKDTVNGYVNGGFYYE